VAFSGSLLVEVVKREGSSLEVDKDNPDEFLFKIQDIINASFLSTRIVFQINFTIFYAIMFPEQNSFRKAG
jgi:hypothetical protein